MVSAFDAPILAGNLAHELTNALFALHLHLDEPAPANGSRVRGRNGRRARPGKPDGSRQAIENVLGRLDELSRGLRLVSRVPSLPNVSATPAGREPRTSLAEWWSLARVVVLVSVPKGIDIHADLPRDLPSAISEPSELTACAVLVTRRVVGAGRVEPPCSLRLVARAEGPWIRMTAIAHGLLPDLEPEPPTSNGSRFMLEEPDPRAASVLVARAAPRGASRHTYLPGNVP